MPDYRDVAFVESALTPAEAAVAATDASWLPAAALCGALRVAA